MLQINQNAVLWREVDGLVIVLLIASSNFIELNKIGSAIWKLVAEGNTPDQIIEKMLKSYDVSKEKLTADVNDFIAQMVAKGMVIQ
jgi:hypothetical protein